MFGLLLVLAAQAQVPPPPPAQNTITIDTGEQLAVAYDIWPHLDQAIKATSVRPIPAWATQAHIEDITLSGRARLAIRNDSAAPMVCEGALSVRYDRFHDPIGWWDWAPINGGADFVITTPIQPGETRHVYLLWENHPFSFNDPRVDGHQDKTDFGIFVCYEPRVRSINGQQVDPENFDQAHALGCWVTIDPGYGDETGLHAYPPRGRFRATVRYQ